MIKRVQIAGLRGKSFDIQTGPITLVIGQNTAGKTTIADAVKWALLGYIPGMSAPPRGWGDLLGNGMTQASVELELDKSTVLRSMWLEKGAVKIDGPGSEWQSTCNVLALDPEKFFAASGPVKAQMVAEASGTSFDWKSLVPDELQNEGFKHALSWSSWVGLAIDTAKTNRSMAADQKKTYTATLRGLEGLRHIVIEDDSFLKSKQDAGKEEVGKLREQIRAVNDQLTKALQPKGSDAQGKLDAVRRTLQNFMGKDHDAETYDQRLRDCNMKRDELKASVFDMPKQGELEKLRTQAVQMEAEVKWHEARLGQLNNDVKRLGEKYAELRKAKCCPTCGSKGKVFAEALKTAEAAEQKSILGGIELCDSELQKCVAEWQRLTKRVKAGDEYWAQKDALEAELGELAQEAKLIELWKQHDALVAEQQTQAQELDTAALQERKYELECDLNDQLETNQFVEKELAAISYKRSQKKQLGMIEQQLEGAEKLWTAANQHVGQLEELRRRFTAMSLEPILATLAIFTAGIFTEPLSLEGHELGRMVGNRWVPLDQFSGAEIAVAMAALTCALQPGNAAKNLVLADELSSFDDEHLAQFLHNVADAQSAGLLEQFVGFTIPRKNVKALPKSVKVVAIK